MNLILDIGNTRAKFALFEGQTLLFQEVGDNQEFLSFLKGKKIKNAVVSSVIKNQFVELEKTLDCPIIHISSSTPIPIENLYLTKDTLGIDRLANAVAANSIFPQRNVLVVDCGTCVKYDFVNHKNQYLGGSISPGLQMRFKALNQFTGKLPLLKPEAHPSLIGDSTETAITSGVINGLVAEIKGVIKSYTSIYENLTVILTGGDASFFDKELKSNIFVEPTLTLIGLNEILLYNTPN